MARTYLILGPSGRGKTTSLEKLDKQTTSIINAERKSLPFRGAALFKMIKPKTSKEIMDAIVRIKSSTDIRTFVLDSFSAFSDMVNAECNVVYSGYDIYRAYNNQIYAFFKAIKNLTDNNIDVILIGHDETLSGEGGTSIQRRLKVKGKEWEGLVEKEFDTVLWADMIIEADKSRYEFVTQTNGLHPAKSAKGMLPLRMTNDMPEVLRLSHEYDNAELKEKVNEALKS